MPDDLSDLLERWPYEPGKINVRIIEGDDAEPRLQMRLDLGVLQMEMSGRPDGARPNGYESLLDSFEALLEDYVPQDGGDAEYLLTAEDCRLLRDEAVQYYHRYVSLLVVGEYEGVVRDTTRNLRVLDLCRDHAENEDDRVVLEQFRPYLLMMRARALASEAVTENEADAAVFHIDRGLDELRSLFESSGQAEDFEAATEVQLLRGMRAELMKKLPAGQKTELTRRLQEAIEGENYELAAILRDELNQLKDHA